MTNVQRSRRQVRLSRALGIALTPKAQRIFEKRPSYRDSRLYHRPQRHGAADCQGLRHQQKHGTCGCNDIERNVNLIYLIK